MPTRPPTTVAVIFISARTGEDEAGYGVAAAAMEKLAAAQPGYVGIDSARGDDGVGITVSYWQSEAAARAWHDNPEHAAIRDAGRGRWYAWYDLHVAHVSRSYDWAKRA